MRQKPRGLQPGKSIVIQTHTHTHTQIYGLISSTDVNLVDGLNPKIISGYKDNQKLNAYNKTFDSMYRIHGKSLEHSGVDLLNITDYILVYNIPCKKWHIFL